MDTLRSGEFQGKWHDQPTLFTIRAVFADGAFRGSARFTEGNNEGTVFPFVGKVSGDGRIHITRTVEGGVQVAESDPVVLISGTFVWGGTTKGVGIPADGMRFELSVPLALEMGVYEGMWHGLTARFDLLPGGFMGSVVGQVTLTQAPLIGTTFVVTGTLSADGSLMLVRPTDHGVQSAHAERLGLIGNVFVWEGTTRGDGIPAQGASFALTRAVGLGAAEPDAVLEFLGLPLEEEDIHNMIVAVEEAASQSGELTNRLPVPVSYRIQGGTHILKDGRNLVGFWFAPMDASQRLHVMQELTPALNFSQSNFLIRFRRATIEHIVRRALGVPNRYRQEGNNLIIDPNGDLHIDSYELHGIPPAPGAGSATLRATYRGSFEVPLLPDPSYTATTDDTFALTPTLDAITGFPTASRHVELVKANVPHLDVDTDIFTVIEGVLSMITVALQAFSPFAAGALFGGLAGGTNLFIGGKEQEAEDELGAQSGLGPLVVSWFPTKILLLPRQGQTSPPQKLEADYNDLRFEESFFVGQGFMTLPIPRNPSARIVGPTVLDDNRLRFSARLDDLRGVVGNTITLTWSGTGGVQIVSQHGTSVTIAPDGPHFHPGAALALIVSALDGVILNVTVEVSGNNECDRIRNHIASLEERISDLSLEDPLTPQSKTRLGQLRTEIMELRKRMRIMGCAGH